jgi:hypothetical protein
LTATAIKPSPAREPTELEKLHDRLAEFSRHRNVLQVSVAKLRAHADHEATARAELDALSNSEIDAMKVWAVNGCAGDAPAPDLKHRKALAEKLASATAASAAAQGSVHDLDFQLGQIDHEISGITKLIEQAAINSMLSEFESLRAHHDLMAAQCAQTAAKIHGLRTFFGNEGRRLTDYGKHDAGKAFLAVAERMAVKLAIGGVSQQDMQLAAKDWSRRFEALRSGG